MSAFKKHKRSGRCVATFSAFEADLIRSLAGQLIELLHSEEAIPRPDAAPGSIEELEAMLESEFSGPTKPPEDPVLARLFPTAYRNEDDAEAAADFRRYTGNSLRQGKAANAACLIDVLEDAGLPDEPEEGLFIDVELDPATASAWLRALTDLRLAIGVRLEVEEDDEEFWEELEDDDPRGPMHEIYLWLGWVQETLISAVMK